MAGETAQVNLHQCMNTHTDVVTTLLPHGVIYYKLSSLRPLHAKNNCLSGL